MNKLELKSFIVADNKSFIFRLIIFLICFGILFLSKTYLNPIVWKLFAPSIANFSDGPKHLLRHLFFYSTCPALISLATVFVLVKQRILIFPSFKYQVGRSIKIGLITALLMCLLLCVVWFALGKSFQFKINMWSITGNVFSNLNEEIEYRLLMYGASLYLFRNRWAAIIISAAIFTWSHSHYPLLLLSTVAIGGITLGYIYSISKNLLAPWIYHQVVDMILDAILSI